MDKEKLIAEANKARQIAVCLAENIYRYLGGNISKEGLKEIVDGLISDDIITRLDHLYIKKDAYENTFIAGFVDDPENESVSPDDTEELRLKDDSNI